MFMKSSVFWDIIPCTRWKTTDVSEENVASIFKSDMKCLFLNYASSQKKIISRRSWYLGKGIWIRQPILKIQFWSRLKNITKAVPSLGPESDVSHKRVRLVTTELNRSMNYVLHNLPAASTKLFLNKRKARKFPYAWFSLRNYDIRFFGLTTKLD
jgi:hypothetical protein